MIRYSCPHCNERLQVDESRAGKAFVCGLCGQSTLVPGGKAKPAMPVPAVPPARPTVYTEPEVLPPPVYHQAPYPQQPPTVVVIQQPAPPAPQHAPAVAGRTVAGAAHPLATGLLMLWIASGLIGMVIGVFAWIFELGDAATYGGGAGMLGASLGMGLLGMLSGGVWLFVGIPVVVFWMVSRSRAQ